MQGRRQQEDRSGPLTLEQVVAELVDEFFDLRDWPAEHRCTTEGPSACSHETGSRRALLLRLAGIVQPGTGAPRDPDSKKTKGLRGSPAPWASGPVHLVDEAYRGAVRFDRALRAALDLGPLWVHRGVGEKPRIGPRCAVAAGSDDVVATCVHPSCQPIRKAITTVAAETPVDAAGPAALRGLPLLVSLLKERDATDPLVAGPLVDPARPERGRSWGTVERAVHRWHSAARELTGHAEKPAILRQRRNPFAGQGWVGPTCADAWSCGHLSCRLVFLAPLPEWGTAHCPFCGSVGFVWDQTWGVLRCDHPRCRDERGQRPAWSMEAFMQPITEIVDTFGEQP